MSLTPEEQQQFQISAAEMFEKIAAQMRAGEIAVLHFESEVEDDWAWSHKYMQVIPEPRFFKYTIKVERLPESDWEVQVWG